MRCASRMSLESHRSAATLYITGELTTVRVLEAVDYMERLPAEVRALCVDLRGARRSERNTLWTLELALRNWRAARRAMTRVKLAPDMETNLIAIKFAHQRWSPAASGARAVRFRDCRQAVVTRSLRERGSSETR